MKEGTQQMERKKGAQQMERKKQKSMAWKWKQNGCVQSSADCLCIPHLAGETVTVDMASSSCEAAPVSTHHRLQG